jgi:hypothetical protein
MMMMFLLGRISSIGLPSTSATALAAEDCISPLLPLLDQPDVPLALSLQILAHLQSISDSEHARVIFDEG